MSAHGGVGLGRGVILCAVAALFVSGSLPPLDLWPLAWFGLAPLLLGLRRAGWLGAGGLGFAFGALFCVGAFYWSNGVATITPLSFLVMLIIFCTYYLLFGVLYRASCATGLSGMLVVAPALWVALEYARSNMPVLAMPWNLLGHSQYRFLPTTQVADLAGVYGVSFVLVAVSQFLSEILERFLASRSAGREALIGRGLVGRGLAVALLLVLVLGYGWYHLGEGQGSERLRLAVVQPNVVTRDNMPLEAQTEQLRAYEALTRDAATNKPSLIVWPASSLPAPMSTSSLVRSAVARLARESGAYLLVGSAGGEKFGMQKQGFVPHSNSEFLIGPNGQLVGQYNKIWLVPFNEYVPLQGVISWPRWIATMKHGFVPGDTYTLFRVAGASFGTPVCWESLFPDFFRRFVKDGANLMVSVTNEGFFGRTPAPYQILAMNVFRAIENRVSVVRAATTGISAIIDPQGRIVERVRGSDGADLFVSGILVQDVPLSQRRTFYTRHGDVFTFIVTGIGALILVASLKVRLVRRDM